MCGGGCSPDSSVAARRRSHRFFHRLRDRYRGLAGELDHFRHRQLFDHDDDSSAGGASLGRKLQQRQLAGLLDRLGGGMLDGIRMIAQPLLEIRGLGHRAPGLGQISEQRLDARRRIAQRVDRAWRQPCRPVVGQAHEMIEGFGQRHADLDTRHRQAAVERVAGAVELLRDGVGPARLIAGGDELAQRRQVSADLAREDVEQHRVHGRQGRRDFRRRDDSAGLRCSDMG